ncbi:MAG: UDP-N-acetylmuramoyl-L-alanine--D-glutamate ligase [Candidatus Aminicenantes bacterium]|nr:UDP-N-acetylmuramoyl-L-alanine--D-glutamate ligase [Candidatus Aminicenantes bacterium]
MKDNQIAVLGFGKTGQAVLEFVLTHEPGASVVLFNDAEIADRERQEFFAKRGVRFLIGAEKFSELAACRLVILSPGFDGKLPRFSALRMKGVEVISEIEYAYGLIQARIIAVSGSNGKSTTVSLIHHVLIHSGRKSILAGNIGFPLIARVGDIHDDSIVVLELSSFQLEEIVDFRADVAVLLNITPDHMDRYPSMAAYAHAKYNLFKNQRPADLMVLNADDPLLHDVKQLGPGKPWWFSSTQAVADGAFLESQGISLSIGAEPERISLQCNPLRGIHNLENIMAATLACRAVGLTPAEIESGLKSFQGLPHRMEVVGSVGRVEFINDSKATNVDAALKSIASIEGNLVVILGGKDKGSDFGGLEKSLAKKARKILLMGQAAPLIAAQLSALEKKLIHVRDLNEAVHSGYEILRQEGGVVLLTPACASFDMFENFEHRGRVFNQEVTMLRGREMKNG